MELSTTRTIDAPIERVWSLQVDHEHWPQHLPNFKEVVRHAPDTPFGVGSSADITQPGLGTVTWTVDRYEDAPDRKVYSWKGTSRGTAYMGRHEVEEMIGNRTQLTLTIVAEGGMARFAGPLLKGRMRKAIEDEARAFERWALAVSVG